MIKIFRYEEKFKKTWDDFVNNSKNSMFMFKRDYMDYHKDRFTDCSLMFFNEDELVALFPSCIDNVIVRSHGGLTFGGFITGSSMKQHIMNDCFKALIAFSREQNWTTIIYKAIPHIYCSQAAEEDRFSLFLNNARLSTVDVSTYVKLSSPLKMPKGRKAQISRAKRENVEIELLTSQKDYDEFIELENDILSARHNTKAVHTSLELKMLHDRFPENIHLFGAVKDDQLIAGTVIYEYENVIHTQYMAANDIAREIGALDLVISYIMEKYKSTKAWLDFGISTEHDKIYLNEGLVSQKEGFGGRTGVYEIWRLDL